MVEIIKSTADIVEAMVNVVSEFVKSIVLELS